jgi:tetratricopeptide (TPR) repeat protein
MNQANNSSNAEEAEIMFSILDFARLHGRKIYEDQVRISFGDTKSQQSFKNLISAEYLRKVKKEGLLFYAITSNGLNLFEDKRKEETVPKDLRERILEKLNDVVAKLGMKPWEIMFYIIHVIGNRQPITTDEIMHYFQERFQDTKGTSRPNVYRNLQRMRMKGYIEHEKIRYSDFSPYVLSEKGKEIFKMTKADATSKLRTVEEWDAALRQVTHDIDDKRKQDDNALFYTVENVLPDNLDNQQLIWALYTQAAVYELKGELDKAEETYLRMEGISEEISDSRARAYALKGLGNVASRQEKFSVAEQHYKRCQRIAQTLQDNPLLSDVLNNLGSCLYMDDKIDDALEQFENALQLTGNDASRQAATLYNKGLCYARKEDLTQAKELWSKSLHLYETLHEAVEINKVRHNLRELDRKEKREYLRETYEKAIKTGTTPDIKKAYKELASFIMDDFNATKGD